MESFAFYQFGPYMPPVTITAAPDCLPFKSSDFSAMGRFWRRTFCCFGEEEEADTKDDIASSSYSVKTQKSRATSHAPSHTESLTPPHSSNPETLPEPVLIPAAPKESPEAEAWSTKFSQFTPTEQQKIRKAFKSRHSWARTEAQINDALEADVAAIKILSNAYHEVEHLYADIYRAARETKNYSKTAWKHLTSDQKYEVYGVMSEDYKQAANIAQK